MMSVPLVVNLNDKQAVHLDVVGGKGANLAILYQRSFRVPNAFILTTHAYELVVNRTEIQTSLSAIDQINVDNIQELESLSQQIRDSICRINLPDELIQLIFQFYSQLNVHVAVRSSATAEDLPENSFAGQQDTYLHVTRENLIDKIKQCWASLFTSRAISYRKQSNIDQRLVKLAVVVQEMISSEVSGVAFTANPMTGLRDEVVIDSTYGLGEALVSGLVTPDHYEILMKPKPIIRVKTVGEKGLHIIGKDHGGGTETIQTNENDKKNEALTDDLILQLAKLAKNIESSYNHRPQDLEWAYSRGDFFVLQARPITTLFPLPNPAFNESDLRCMLSFGAIQGFLEPMTPLGQCAIRTCLASTLRHFGFNRTSTLQDDISSDSSRFFAVKSSAERLWFDTTGVLTAPVGKFFGVSLADSTMGKILNHINTPSYFQRTSRFSSWKIFFSFLFFVIPTMLRSIRNLLFPRYAQRLFVRKMNDYHRFIDQGFRESQTLTQSTDHLINVLSQLTLNLYSYAIPCISSALVSLKVLQRFSSDPIDALALTRAVESNPTTEMNLRLWKITLSIRENSEVLNLFESQTTDKLLEFFRMKSFEQSIQIQLEQFIETYGCRGIGEIDLGHERWSDRPELVLEQIKAYLKITNPDKAIHRIHEQSQSTAYDAFRRIENQLKYPRVQSFLLNFFFKRLRILFSLRECPKFDGFIRTFGKCRQALFDKAQLAVEKEFILKADDICFLFIGELRNLGIDVDTNNLSKRTFWKNLIEQRRNEYVKQTFVKRIPLILLSNGLTFYDASTLSNETIELADGEYLGSPVSPGIYQGKVRIVHDPLKSELEPGEILVCTATDPAWTSLFPIVGALVLEMGGMLQHGAIVSREYGLPAVVGVSNATKIFRNGQFIEVNGSNGKIRILSE